MSPRDRGFGGPDAPHAVRQIPRVAARSLWLLLSGRLHHPRPNVGRIVHFADGSNARVYRETRAGDGYAVDPVVLVVGFVLRGVRGPLHAAFRAESWLNIPLFVGAPGFTSKLWLADDATGRYRGIYEWDGAGRATSYIHYLNRILGLVSVPGSVRTHVIPNVHRDAALADPGSLTAAVPEPEPGPQEWWRPTAVRSAPSRSRWRRQ